MTAAERLDTLRRADAQAEIRYPNDGPRRHEYRHQLVTWMLRRAVGNDHGFEEYWTVERIATFDNEALAGIVALIDRARDQGRAERR